MRRPERLWPGGEGDLPGPPVCPGCAGRLAPDRPHSRSLRFGGDESAVRRARHRRQGLAGQSLSGQQERPAGDLRRTWAATVAPWRSHGRTSRSRFFLSSFQKWREAVVLGIATREVMADLGYGVIVVAQAPFTCRRENWRTGWAAKPLLRVSGISTTPDARGDVVD